MSSSDDQDARKNGEDSPRSSFKSKSPSRSRSRSRSMSVENKKARRSHSSSSNGSASPKEKTEDKLMETSDIQEENFKSDRKDSDIENNISYKNEEKSRSRSKSKSRGKSRSKTKSRSKSRSRSRSRSKGSGSPKKISRRSRSRSRSRRRSGSHSRRRRSSMRRRSRSPRRRSPSRSRRRRSRSRSATPIDGARLHVAELDVETRKRDLEKIFEKFGRLREIWMARNPPCFAFVVYNRQKDSDRAMRETDGMMVGHCRIKVTQARPRVRGGRFRGGYDPNLRCYQCGELGHFSRNCTDTKFGYKRPPTPPGSRRTGVASIERGRRRSRSRSRGRRSRS